jgi:glycosyltransferase involved in cell wall biosynthesis
VTKLPISVCIISGAESARIGRCLGSVAEWVSEIIVVLNEEVTDGTEQIIASFGGKVFREPWRGMIAQKNSAFAKAEQPWVLGLDADEAVSPELRTEIARLFEGRADYCAYSFPRCSFYLGRWIRHGEWYPDRCARLLRRDKAQWGGTDPHGRLQIDDPVGKLRGELLHYTSEGLNQQVAKAVVYADEFARQREAGGKEVSGVDLVFRPPWRFVRGYFFRLGFLDGWSGFTIAWMTAFYTFLRYSRAREARRKLT